jgi:transglutaminase-like putative cysteine protease
MSMFAPAATHTIGGMPARKLDLVGPDTYFLPGWKAMRDPSRMAGLRKIVMEYGRDPRVAKWTIDVLKAANAQPRDYKAQAAALLHAVQHQIYYANEAGERLQSPEATLRLGFGDCDDMAILLASACESIRLPWRFVLSGSDKRGRPIRWIEGTKYRKAKYAHIYLIVGTPPFQPKEWQFAEPTLRGAPLGWDVVNARRRNMAGGAILPELGALGDASIAASDPSLEAWRAPSTWQSIKAEVKNELHPVKLVPTAMKAIVIGLISTAVIEAVKRATRK